MNVTSIRTVRTLAMTLPAAVCLTTGLLAQSGPDSGALRGAKSIQGGHIDPNGTGNLKSTLGSKPSGAGDGNTGSDSTSPRRSSLGGTGVRVGSDGARQADGKATPILFSAQNQPQSPAPPTSEILVFLQPGSNVRRFAADHGVLIQHGLKSDPNAYVMLAATPENARAAHAAMMQDRRVRAAYPNKHSTVQKASFTPNDPYFFHDNPAAGWPGQWHLYNPFTPGLDARVMGAWNRDITGQGVTIGIVDDCLQGTHPDLAQNYVATDSWDFAQNDGDPSPWYTSDMHGTSVAGVAAARGGNGIGVTGAAPYAGLAGLRCDFHLWTGSDSEFVDATLYHSSGTNRHITVKNHSYSDTTPYVNEQAMADSLATSTAAGTIHCFAAGNFRGDRAADSGELQPQNSPDSITVAAIGSSGLFSTYSSFGSNVFVTAPSSSNRSTGYLTFEYNITTTDLVDIYGYCPVIGRDYFPDPNYTSVFGGTSSASPLVAGVMALGKQAQPNLNTRFAKHLLALTSDVVDPNDSTIEGDGDGVTPGSAWRSNAGGYLFNQNYGMGLINADAFTKAAKQYSGVTTLQVENTGLITVGAALPDNDATGIRRTFYINSTTPLEEMMLTLNVTHPWRGDVEAYLTSPSGTRARVMRSYWYYNPYPEENDIHWTYAVNTFWGENPHGTWTLVVKDVKAEDVGTFDSFSATARMGTLVAAQTGAASTVAVTNVTGAIGQTVPLTATLRRASDNVVLTGGTLTFSVAGTQLGTAVTNANGVATFNYKVPDTLGLGGQQIAVSFAGTDLYSASNGAGTLTITKANTTVTVTNVSGVGGQTVTLKATLRRATDKVILYGGTIAFSVDGVQIGTAVTDNNGVASLNYTIPAGAAIGNHTMTASFAGTTKYNASTGTGTLQVKDKTTVTVANVTGVRSAVVTLSGTLRRVSDGVALYGGTLTFKVDGVAVGTAVTDGNGKAALAYTIPTTMLVGTHKITVSFAGTAGYAASSGTGTLTVQ